MLRFSWPCQFCWWFYGPSEHGILDGYKTFHVIMSYSSEDNNQNVDQFCISDYLKL